MAIIQKHSNIVLRKREAKAILSAMRNLMPESPATAPTSLLAKRDARAFATGTGFPRVERIFYLDSL
jgi:hypothetical protein